jgi:hypothetical protein
MMAAWFTSPARNKVYIKSLVRDRKKESLIRLLGKDPTKVIEVYPWVRELKETQTPVEKIVDILVQTEHLDWMELLPGNEDDDEHLRRRPENIETPDTLGHLEECAHSLYERATTLVQEKWPYRMRRHQYGPAESEDGNTDIFAKREQDVFKFCGVGGVFHPNAKRAVNYGKLIWHGDYASVTYSHVEEIGSAQSNAISLLLTVVGMVGLPWNLLSQVLVLLSQVSTRFQFMRF